MIVPCEIAPLPLATPETISHHLDEIASLTYPGFKIDANGDVGGVRQYIVDTFEERTISLDRFGLMGDNDFGWHMDGKPNDSRILEITVHQTIRGAGQVALLPSKPYLWEYNRQRALYGYDVPEYLADLLIADMTDDELTDSVMHCGQLTVGDVVIFTTNGPRTPLHEFTTTKPPRASLLSLTRMTYNPDEL